MTIIQKLRETIVNLLPITGKYIHINRGYIPDEESEDDDIMGVSQRFDWKVVKEDGDWVEEFKNIAQETQNWMDCTGHGISNIIDVLYKVKFNQSFNSSEAYINGMAGTSRTRGNSMRVVLDSIRKNGIVAEDVWPEKNRWKIIPSRIINAGRDWLKEYQFGYDGLWATTRAMREAIKYSPLYVGGYAWYRKGMLYYSVGKPNHCFTIIKIPPKIAGDSYPPTVKHLDENFKLYFVKRIFLGKYNLKYNQAEIDKWIARGFKFIQRPEDKGQIYKLTNNGLVHLKSRDEIRKELKKYIPEDDIIVWLSRNKILTGLPEEYYHRLLA